MTIFEQCINVLNYNVHEIQNRGTILKKHRSTPTTIHGIALGEKKQPPCGDVKSEK